MFETGARPIRKTIIFSGKDKRAFTADNLEFLPTKNFKIKTLTAVLSLIFTASGVNAYAEDFVGNAIYDASIHGVLSVDANFRDNSRLEASITGAIIDGTQSFSDSSVLNASAGQAVSGGRQDFFNNSVFNATAANAIDGGTQSFSDSSVLNALADAINGGAQGFKNNTQLNASASDAVHGGSQWFFDQSSLNATEANALSGGRQDFVNDSVLNATAANAIDGGSQSFSDASVLNASASAINNGTQAFKDNAQLNASASDAVHGGTQWFFGQSSLNATAANAVSGGWQDFAENAALNASASQAVSGGRQDFFNNSVLNATAANAIDGGSQSFSDASVLNASASAINNGTQAFKDNAQLNASASDAVHGGTQWFFGQSSLNATEASAVSGGWQDFAENAALNASASQAVSGGRQAFFNNSVLNATTANAIDGGSQSFSDASVLNASASAINNGTQAFKDNAQLNASASDAVHGGTQWFFGQSSLNATEASAVSGGWQDFAENATLNASASQAVSGGRQAFFNNSVLNATAANAIDGGSQSFSDASVLNASASAINNGIQSFKDNAQLNASASGAVHGGTQWFFGQSSLNATAANAVSGGWQDFAENAALNASASQAVSDGRQDFVNDSVLNATAANAIDGGSQSFSDASVLNASASAINNGIQSFKDNAQLNASASGAVHGGTQWFFGQSSLNATEASAVSGGWQDFAENATLNASASQAVSDGRQDFFNHSVLNALAAGAVAGGAQKFENDSVLNATVGDAINQGQQYFYHNTALNASAGNALNGGIQQFRDSSTLHATTANAVSGGNQWFYSGAVLNATVAEAVTGGVQSFYDTELDIQVNNALAGANVNLYAGAAINLQGHSIRLSSLRGEVGTEIRGLAGTVSALTLRNDLDSVYSGILTNNGGLLDLIKQGAGTQILEGGGSVINDVRVEEGTLSFQGEDDFTSTGNFTTSGGATTKLTDGQGQLLINGTFTQESGSHLALSIGTSSRIVANTAVLDGTLDIDGFALSAGRPMKASELANNPSYTIIHTTAGITGDFTNSPAYNNEDYLLRKGSVSADRKDYNLVFRLAWFDGGKEKGTGDFTTTAATPFEIDVVLDDQALPNEGFNTLWDGKSLQKKGDGELILSMVNQYTGSTVVQEGTLRTDVDNAFASSSEVTVAQAGTLDLNGFAQQANRIAGTGSIVLNGAALNASNRIAVTDNSTFSGMISDGAVAGGSLSKTGAGQLTLTGENSYRGITQVLEGTLAIGDGNVISDLASSQITIANNATLQFNHSNEHTYLGLLGGDVSSTLSKRGRGQLNLVASGSQLGNVSIEQGKINFEEHGDFVISGDYVTHNGASSSIELEDSYLRIAGSLIQQEGSTLGVFVDARANAPDDITANSLTIGESSTIDITGYHADFTHGEATNSYWQEVRVIHTDSVDGINGDFAQLTVSGSESPVDYLSAFGRNDKQNYFVNIGLSWYGEHFRHVDGTQPATGNFTLEDPASSFRVSAVLSDATATDTWTGKDLTKMGEGKLTLAATNTYTGSTQVQKGTLALAGEGSIAASSSVALQSTGATLDAREVNSDRVQVQNLAGTTGSRVALAGKSLVVNSTADTSFAGDIDASSSQLIKEGARALTLSGNVNYTGDTYVNAGELILDGSNGGAQVSSNVIGQAGSTLSLKSGARLTGWIDPLQVNVDSSSSWSIQANSLLSGLNLAGRAEFANPGNTLTQGRTLTTTDLVGEGGTISLYTVLADSNSVSDKIVIDGGSASGNTLLQINNVGGLGDKTTGDGINVVHTTNNGTTTSTAFSLSNVVNAGAYSYKLTRGSATATDDWFLSSSDVDNPNITNYSSNTSLLNIKMNQTLRYDELSVGSSNERWGDLQLLEKSSDVLAWGRVIMRHDDNHHGDHAVENKANISAVQVGTDLYVASQESGRTSVGAFVTAGQSKADVTHVNANSGAIAAGDSNIKAFGVGGYLTHLTGEGGYVDGVLQTTWFDLTNKPASGSISDNNAMGISASIEAGQRFALGDEAQGYSIEPQTQVMLQTLKMDDVSIQDSGNNSVVRFDNSTQVVLRAGARFSKRWILNETRDTSVWLTPSLIQHVGSPTQVHFASGTQGDVLFKQDLPGTRVSLQSGVDGAINQRVKLSVRLGTEHALGGEQQVSYFGQAGVKVTF